MPILTLKEEVILSAILMAGGQSGGAQIRKKVITLTQKEIVYGTLYNLLEKLILKGYVITGEIEPEPVQGGRRKTLYTITPQGKAALKDTLDMHAAIQNSLSDTV